MTNATMEPSAGPDLVEMPKAGSPRVTVERTCSVSHTRGRSAGACDGLVSFVCMDDPRAPQPRKIVSVQVFGDTEFRLSLDDLIDTVLTLAPPWLLRKKLGL